MATTRTRTPKGQGNPAADEGLEKGASNADGNSGQAPSRSLTIASQGIYTGEEFASFMSALMTDLMEGSVTPDKANAICNAGGKLLKVVEMRYRYGKDQPQRPPTFMLVNPPKEA